MIENNKDKMFVELAKVKSTPTPIKVEVADDPFDSEEENEGQLLVDVYQDKDDIVVQSAVAGIPEDSLEITITSESVTIRGKRERSEKIEEKDFFYQECYWGKFSRSIILPCEIDTEKSVATLKNGVLMIRMPKLSRQKTKKLKVRID